MAVGTQGVTKVSRTQGLPEWVAEGPEPPAEVNMCGRRN